MSFASQACRMLPWIVNAIWRLLRSGVPTAYTAIWHLRLRSGSANCDMLIAIWHLLLRSDSVRLLLRSDCDLALAVEVR